VTSLLSTVETMGTSLGACVLGALQKPLSLASLDAVIQKRQQLVKKLPRSAEPCQTEAAILQGIVQQEFVCFFQPKICVATGNIKGMEALARWQHPTLGLLFPNSFIATVEASDVVMKLFTLSMLDQMLLQMQQWQAAEGLVFSVSLNVSAASFSDAAFIAGVTDRVNASRIAPQQITFEITETALMADLGASLGALARLRLKGFGLSIDDYGTGFSSLQQINNIPATELKIDRAFVHEVSQRENLRIMLEGAIDLGRKLQLTVVAEGVETLADWRILQQLGCELAQGYLIAKPMPGAKYRLGCTMICRRCVRNCGWKRCIECFKH
jgi:EAL domain-containing protein (putative c-di-GMP-specific phosphodiesterase class I)